MATSAQAFERARRRTSPAMGVVVTFLLAGSGTAAPVDLSTWTAESYIAVSGFPAGSWVVSGDGTSVTQTQNGQPTLFYSDFGAFGLEATGTITVTGSDDDFIGFVLGFQPNDTTNAAADYLLVDWKRGTQFFDFGAPSSDPGGTAPAGLAVSRVVGIPTADEFWQHATLGVSGGGGLTELQRGASLGSTGWIPGVDYEFRFDFGPNNLQVFVDDVLELDITGSFDDGRLGFYNFSQAGVTYAAFTVDVGSFPIPEPGAALLAGISTLFFAGRCRQRPS